MLSFPLIANNAIHNHFMQTNINVQFDNVFVIDKHNFLYSTVII